LEVKAPLLDFALPPLEVVWRGMHLGEFGVCFVAPLPLPLLLLPLLCSFDASAVSISGAIVPWRALVNRCAAWMHIVSGETSGFVIYWCLKNTLLLILMALVFVI
jgi:hypothetical protein